MVRISQIAQNSRLSRALRLASLLIPPAFCAFFAASFVSAAPANELTTPGVMREFTASIADVRQAVLSVQKDHIVHGTLIFDKEPVLTGAEAVSSTPLFDPWQGPGEVYYKIREKAIAPRHFVDAGDIGTIGVRYIIIPVNDLHVRLKIDALYLETARKRIHPSDGNVEKSEMNEIKDAIESLQEAAAEAADARRREISNEVVRQSYSRQRSEESTRVSSAQSSQKELTQEIDSLRHELERRIKAPGADLKAAPFHSAASLKTLPAYSEVVVLIVTPYWLGVETPEGQRGWLPMEQLEQLP